MPKKKYGNEKEYLYSLPGKEETQGARASRTVPHSLGNRERFISQGLWPGKVIRLKVMKVLHVFLFFCKYTAKAGLRWLSYQI